MTNLPGKADKSVLHEHLKAMSKNKKAAKAKHGEEAKAGRWKILGWLGGGAGILIFTIAASYLTYNGPYQDKVKNGQDYLKLGLYPQAKAEFQEAIDLHFLRHVAVLSKLFEDSAKASTRTTPGLLNLDKDAQWGLEKASVFDPPDSQQIEPKLEKLQTGHPDDEDVRVLSGRFHASQLNFSQAERDYRAALDLRACFKSYCAARLRRRAVLGQFAVQGRAIARN